MVTPISNDKILSSDSGNSSIAGKKKADNGMTAQQGGGSSDTVQQGEKSGEKTSSVDVERASQVYSNSTAKTSPGKDFITTLEQAKAVAAEISRQMEDNSQQAFKAHTGASSSNLAVLLEATPA